MDNLNLGPDDLIEDAENLLYYKNGIKFFYLQLVHLNVNVFILDHVLTFPYHLFTVPGESLFFRMVFENFFYASLLIITRIAADYGADVFTLPRFKNRVRQFIKPEIREAIDRRLRKVRFDETTQSLLEKARTLRSERVAHVLEDVALSRTDETIVTFGEIKSMRDELNSLLDVLSFNVAHMMLPLQYHPDVRHPPGVDSRPDIEAILDDVARRSILLNLPETNPTSWNFRKDNLPEQDIEILNKYRRKFDLTEI